MHAPKLLALPFLVWASSLPMTALAGQRSTFDCTKAQGEVEKAVCADTTLTALDVRLAEVYEAASARARGELAKHLRAEQRGWVKGRNNCWKARDVETWITATWTVRSVKECVDAQYRLRTSELQSVWRLVEPRTVSYVCQDNPANEMVANFFDTQPATIRLERGDRTVTLWRVGVAGDSTYEGQNVSVERDGDRMRVNWLNTDTGKTDELQCKAR